MKIKKNIIIITLIIIMIISASSFSYEIRYKKNVKNVENLYKSFSSRKEASIQFKTWIIPALKRYNYDTLFPNLKVKELAIILNILFITETSTKEADGNWYVAHSDLFALNSLFGVKNPNGVLKNTWEDYGKNVRIKDKFAAYNTIDDCLMQWLKFVSTPRYKLFVNSSTWEEAILQLKYAGYMTDDKYPTKAIKIYNNTLKYIY